MRTLKLTRLLILAATLTGVAHAGQAIACHWVAVPGTAFGALSALRDQAMGADDSRAAGERARAQLVELRAAIKPNDALSLLKAGFWVTTMHGNRVSPDTDGPALILKALELRPDDAEYEFFAAVAFLHTDKATFQKHWDRARKLAKPGSATATNMKIVQDLYHSVMD